MGAAGRSADRAGGRAGERAGGGRERHGGSATEGADRPLARSPARVLFVTGRLAEPALRRVLDELDAPFEKHVAVLKITVAALMTTPWIAKFLEVPPDTDLVLLPGLVRRRDRAS